MVKRWHGAFAIEMRWDEMRWDEMRDVSTGLLLCCHTVLTARKPFTASLINSDMLHEVDPELIGRSWCSRPIRCLWSVPTEVHRPIYQLLISAVDSYCVLSFMRDLLYIQTVNMHTGLTLGECCWITLDVYNELSNDSLYWCITHKIW